jgi:hypothetical protein
MACKGRSVCMLGCSPRRTNVAFTPSRRYLHGVRRELLQCLGHVRDSWMFVGVGHRAGRMSHDGVTHPRINPGLNRSALERMPPTVVGLDLRMIDPEGPDPLCQPLGGLHCRPPVVGVPGRLAGRW